MPFSSASIPSRSAGPLTGVPSTAPAAAGLHLRCDGISLSYPDRRVLTDIDLVVPAGRPTGLLGENGSGKTTLLLILAGCLQPDTGTVEAPGPVGLLRQELPFPGSAPVGDVVEDALARSRRLERELAEAGEALACDAPELAPGTADSTPAQLAQQYDHLLARATLADVWNAPRRAEEVLAGLNLADLAPGTRLAQISGGQRERLALAHLLIARPTTWLLDEPTNHLDDDGAAFLSQAVRSHPGPVLIASHDRAFLDDATDAQLDLEAAESPLSDPVGGLTSYTGGYSDYLLARMDARDRWEQRYRREQDELVQLRRAVAESAVVGHPGREPRSEVRRAKKFYADRNAKVVSRRLREARARLEQLESEQVRRPPAELHFTRLPSASSRSSGVLLSASEVAVDGRLTATSLTLSAGERLLITGANGTGKSTLLQALTGRLTPTGGTVTRAHDLRIGYLGQDDLPDPGTTARNHLSAAAASDEHSLPELFGLVHPRDLDRPLDQLSRGQLRRVMLAGLLLASPDLLVLDEPTNHLALVTATRLEAALQEWNGTVLIASHDRWLRRRWQGAVLEM